MHWARTAAQRRLCAALLGQHYPLGPARAPGCRLSYLLAAAGGPLGLLSFVAAPFRLGPRDAFLGWDDRTRGAHIERILSNDRFVLVAGVQVKNLASHVLGKTLQRLARDWEQAHGVRPWMVETCVQSSRPGTSYKAAGWQCVGATRGRPPGAGGAVETKTVWLRGLEPDWQQKLCQQPEQTLGQYPELVHDHSSSHGSPCATVFITTHHHVPEHRHRLGGMWRGEGREQRHDDTGTATSVSASLRVAVPVSPEGGSVGVSKKVPLCRVSPALALRSRPVTRAARLTSYQSEAGIERRRRWRSGTSRIGDSVSAQRWASCSFVSVT